MMRQSRIARYLNTALAGRADQPLKKASHRNGAQSGNIFVILFGAVALTGILAVVGMQTVTGPITTITKATQKNMVENDLMTAAKILIATASGQANNGDCDSDSFVEPEQWRATTGAKPTNGGLLPTTIGATLTDPWGTEYGYCVWDHATIDNVGCGGATQRRLDGPSPGRENQLVLAVVSAGPDKAFQTTCRAWVDANADGNPDQLMVEKTVGSDDSIVKFTYAEAANTGSGLWKIKVGAPDTAQIDKNLEIKDSGGTVRVSVNNTTGVGDFLGLTTDLISAKTGSTVDVDATIKLGKTSGSDENNITNIDQLIGFDDIKFHSSASSGVDMIFKDSKVGIGTSITNPLGTLQLGTHTKASHTEIFFGTGNGTQQYYWSAGTRYGTPASTSPNFDFVISRRGSVGATDAPSFLIDWNTGYIGMGTIDPASPLHIVGGTDSEPGSGGYLVLGSTTSTNISLDDNEIMARDNGAIAPLYLQADGGGVAIHNNLAATNRVIIDNSGNLALGITTPLEKLDVNGDMYLRGDDLYFSHDGATNTDNDYFTYTDSNNLVTPGSTGIISFHGDVARGAAWNAPSAGISARGIYVTQRVGIGVQSPTEALDVNGTIKATNVLLTSDARFKEAIHPLRDRLDGLSLVEQLKPVRYYWKDKDMGEDEQIGLLAQDVEKVLPSAVGGSEDSKTVNYMQLIPVLIKAVQEQQDMIETQDAKIDTNRKDIQALKQRVEASSFAKQRAKDSRFNN